jgi:hypothetical protein
LSCAQKPEDEEKFMKSHSILNVISRAVLVFAIGAFFGLAGAQQKFVRGQAADVKREDALAKAKVAAWKNYLGTLQGAKLDNIIANEKAFLGEIDSYVVDVNVVDEKCMPQPPSCSISIKAAINEPSVESRLRQGAQAAGGKAGAQDDIAFLVMARVADSQTSFDTKTTKRAESTVGTTGSSASADAFTANKTGAAEASADAARLQQSSVPPHTAPFTPAARCSCSPLLQAPAPGPAPAPPPAPA